MRLNLLFEADKPKGFSRRDFLKFMGKGAAAAYGAPLKNLASGVGSLVTSSSISDWIRAYKNSGVNDNDMRHSNVELLLNHNKILGISDDVHRGYVADVVLKLLKSGQGFGALQELHDLQDLGWGTPLFDAYQPLLSLTINHFGGPKGFLRQILFPSNNSGSTDDYYIDIANNFFKNSDVLKNFLRSKGFKLDDLYDYKSNGDLNVLEKLDVISPKEAEIHRASRAAHLDDLQKKQDAREKAGEEKKIVSKDPVMAPHEPGYERRGALDPRSSRPVSKLGPLEGRDLTGPQKELLKEGRWSVCPKCGDKDAYQNFRGEWECTTQTCPQYSSRRHGEIKGGASSLPTDEEWLQLMKL